jgi:predicted phosphodiesterase
MKSLILADVHANLAALEAVLEHETIWDEVLFLGDAVVGGPQPSEVLSVLADLKGIFLMGNHDQEILDVDLTTEAADPHQRWKQWTRRQLSPANLHFLSGFSGSRRLERQGHDLRLIHGVLPSEWGSRLWPDSPESAFTGLSDQYPEPWILLGHSHIQFRQAKGNKTIINPGSVGQSRLGHQLACYAVLQEGVLRLEAVPYDTALTCAALDQLPIERTYLDAWKKGYQLGVLPPHRVLRDFSSLREGGFR